MIARLLHRLRLALLAGVLRLLARLIRAAFSAQKGGARKTAAAAHDSGRVIDGEARRLNENRHVR